MPAIGLREHLFEVAQELGQALRAQVRGAELRLGLLVLVISEEAMGWWVSCTSATRSAMVSCSCRACRRRDSASGTSSSVGPR
jgi:hypothetical protein